jgi:uncharacterized protein (DUF305 family)
VIRLLGLVLLALAVTACGQQDPAPARAPAPPGPQAVASGSPAGGLDATARAFVELVIATDDQAVKLMDMGATGATDPDLRRLAGDLAGVRRAELTELHDILGTAKVPYVDNHAGHDMPGMPTEVELTALAAASADFDAEFTRLARAHLTESTTVAKSGVTAVSHPATHAAAEAMVRERAEALRSLDGLG